MDILYKNANIVTQNSRREIISTGYVSVHDDRVDEVGIVSPSGRKYDEVIDLEGRWLLPGFMRS